MDTDRVSSFGRPIKRARSLSPSLYSTSSARRQRVQPSAEPNEPDFLATPTIDPRPGNLASQGSTATPLLAQQLHAQLPTAHLSFTQPPIASQPMPPPIPLPHVPTSRAITVTTSSLPTPLATTITAPSMPTPMVPMVTATPRFPSPPFSVPTAHVSTAPQGHVNFPMAGVSQAPVQDMGTFLQNIVQATLQSAGLAPTTPQPSAAIHAVPASATATLPNLATGGSSIPFPSSGTSTDTAPYPTLGYSFLSDSRPLDMHVDPKVKAKIWCQEYINLFTLLPSSTSHDDDQCIVFNEAGSLMLSKEKKGEITSIIKWNEASGFMPP